MQLMRTFSWHTLIESNSPIYLPTTTIQCLQCWQDHVQWCYLQNGVRFLSWLLWQQIYKRLRLLIFIPNVISYSMVCVSSQTHSAQNSLYSIGVVLQNCYHSLHCEKCAELFRYYIGYDAGAKHETYAFSRYYCHLSNGLFSPCMAYSCRSQTTQPTSFSNWSYQNDNFRNITLWVKTLALLLNDEN